VLRASTRLTFETGRYVRYDPDYDRHAQTFTSAAAIWDAVLGGEAETGTVRWTFGMYNAFDVRQAAPVSGEFKMLTVPMIGRTLLAGAALDF
jgi:hypothetical protein